MGPKQTINYANKILGREEYLIHSIIIWEENADEKINKSEFMKTRQQDKTKIKTTEQTAEWRTGRKPFMWRHSNPFRPEVYMHALGGMISELDFRPRGSHSANQILINGHWFLCVLCEFFGVLLIFLSFFFIVTACWIWHEGGHQNLCQGKNNDSIWWQIRGMEMN